MAALIKRTGFDIDLFEYIEFEVNFPEDEANPDKLTTAQEKFFCIVATKKRPLDIK